VNTLLITINIINFDEAGKWWFFYPFFGWGIGLLCHGLSVASFGLFGPDWEEKKIKEYMEKDRRD